MKNVCTKGGWVNARTVRRPISIALRCGFLFALLHIREIFPSGTASLEMPVCQLIYAGERVSRCFVSSPFRFGSFRIILSNEQAACTTQRPNQRLIFKLLSNVARIRNRTKKMERENQKRKIIARAVHRLPPLFLLLSFLSIIFAFVRK